MKTTTIEQKVAKAVLQQPKEILIGGRTISVAPPTTATLLSVSEAISLLPQIKLDKEKVVEGSLSIARHCQALGEIVATIMLGSKGGKEIVTIEKRFFFGLIKRKEKKTIDRKKELGQFLLEELSPAELYRLFFDLIKDLQVGDFFGLTTFLIDINLLRPTKVVSETTVYGQ